MIVSYDGTAYSGWQLQAQSSACTIQAEIERALTTVLREDRGTLCVCAAGRTDAGVHAVGQVSDMGMSARYKGGEGGAAEGRVYSGCSGGALWLYCWSQQKAVLIDVFFRCVAAASSSADYCPTLTALGAGSWTYKAQPFVACHS